MIYRITTNAIINNICHTPIFVWEISSMGEQDGKKSAVNRKWRKNEMVLVHPIELALDKLVGGWLAFTLWLWSHAIW